MKPDRTAARIVFISTQSWDRWGGSEELWAQTALHLAVHGFPVSANVQRWSPPHPRILELVKQGVEIRFRPMTYSVPKKAWLALTTGLHSRLPIEVKLHLDTIRPQLVVINEAGSLLYNVELLEL